MIKANQKVDFNFTMDVKPSPNNITFTLNKDKGQSSYLIAKEQF